MQRHDQVNVFAPPQAEGLPVGHDGERERFRRFFLRRADAEAVAY